MRDFDTFTKLVCRQGRDPDIWHEKETEALAKGLCLGCPAVATCLDISTDPANATWTQHGVWGGMDAKERARLRAERASSNAGRYQTVTFTAQSCHPIVSELSL